jgi:Holliday junction resolvase RusA-like endonuclease
VTTRLSFSVPGPPVPCARARVFADRNTGRVRSAVPARTRTYENHVRSVAQGAALAARWSVEDVASYAIELSVFRDVRRGDWDNFSKSITDACNGVLWKDDRQISDAVVRVRYDKAAPRVEVTVERLAPSGDK